MTGIKKARRQFPALLCFFCVMQLSTLRAVEKWFYYPANLLVDKNIDTLETLWRRASKACNYPQVSLPRV